MADIELVIKIPEEKYNQIINFYQESKVRPKDYEIAIINGTPLPKGHGDLKDVDKLKHAFTMWSMAVQGCFTDTDIASIVYNSPTIIEADKEQTECN